MNRDRFRFRVWSEKLKRYYWDYALNVDGDLVPWSVGIGKEREEPGSKLTIEQCTGLVDKNGKLIYENDLVICDVDDIRKRQLRQVVWWKGCFCMKSYGIVQKEAHDYYNIEIIGNIHEKGGGEMSKE